MLGPRTSDVNVQVGRLVTRRRNGGASPSGPLATRISRTYDAINQTWAQVPAFGAYSLVSATRCYNRSTMRPDREIPQRELRNEITEVLRQVAAGQRLRVTVRGRPVADLVPVSEARRFVSRSDFEPIIVDDPLDPRFVDDVHAAVGSTVDEL